MADLFTLPRWTRAHRLEQYGSLGAIRLWRTVCGKNYDLPDPEFDDEPTKAPEDMKPCVSCAIFLPSTEGNTPDA